MPKKKVSFLDYGPVEGSDISYPAWAKEGGVRTSYPPSSEESGWRDFINGLPCILITPMGLLIAFVLAQGDTAWTFICWGGLVVLSLMVSDMTSYFKEDSE